MLDLGIPRVTRYGAFRGEAIPGGKTLIEDMPLTLQQDVTYEETKEYLEKVIMMKYIKHERTCWTTFVNTKKSVENVMGSEVFLTNLEVFGNVVKLCLEHLIFFLNRN